jgi:hypothetical protein
MRLNAIKKGINVHLNNPLKWVYYTLDFAFY